MGFFVSEPRPMARKKIREYHGKHILKEHIKNHSKLSFSAKVKPVLITKETIQTEWKKLKTQHPWLLEEKLVVKPDMLFGKRGKYGLVKVNANIDEVKEFVAERIDTPIKIGDVEGKLTHWIIEPFVKHDVEFYFRHGCYAIRQQWSLPGRPRTRGHGGQQAQPPSGGGHNAVGSAGRNCGYPETLRQRQGGCDIQR